MTFLHTRTQTLAWLHDTDLPFHEELLQAGVHPDLRDSAAFTTLFALHRQTSAA